MVPTQMARRMEGYKYYHQGVATGSGKRCYVGSSVELLYSEVQMRQCNSGRHSEYRNKPM